MRISWIEPNQLAASGIPVDAKDLRSLHAQGIRAILSLTEESPFRYREITHDLLRELEMIYKHIPVEDHCPPTDAQADEIIKIIHESLAQQRPLLIHCHAGVGRTGTALHLYYLSRGLSLEDAKAQIRRTRIQCILVSDEQEAFIERYAREQQ